MDLEQAADNVLAEMAELLPEWDKAEKAFEQAMKKIEEAQRDLEEKWKDTEEKANAFLKQVDDDDKDNKDESNKTKQGHSELKKKVQDGKKDYDEELEHGRESLEQFGEQNVKGLESPLESIFKMVAEAANTLESKVEEIGQEISRLASETVSHFEGEIVNALEENERQMTERHDQLHDWMRDTAQPDMTSKKGDFLTKLNEFKSNTEQKFHETDEHTGTESKSVLDNAATEFGNTIQQIMSFGQTLSSTLGFLGSSVETTGQTIGTVKNTVEDCVKTSNITVESIMGCFEKFTKIAESFSFL